MAKDKLTIWICASITGENMHPMIIGKSKNPRSFKGINLRKYNYESNANAWMTGDIFKKYTMSWDSELCRFDRKLIFLVDNCAAHPNFDSLLTNIKLVFMPANTTSIL